MIPEEQRETAALLGRLTGAAPIETHISAVFVGARDAYKLKKAVTYDFLDFATLHAREYFCRRELALNRPAAPSLYRGVLPVTRQADGGLALDGGGTVVEWVLHMAPLPAADFCDAVAAQGGLTPTMLDAMADAAFALHQAAPEAPRGFDSAGRMAAVLAGNHRSCLDAGIDAARTEALTDRLSALLTRITPALQARAQAGCVRRCHGDLHLGNLVLLDGRPTPFDALEFDEKLAVIDTGYDIAFLLMDLDQRAGRAAANRVMNRYVARSGDAGLLAPLPFWMALRAMVRAHVEARGGGDGAPYLDAAFAYAAPVAPLLIAIGGLQGTGKTFVARALAPAVGAGPGALHLRSDDTRKRLFGVAPEVKLPPEAYAEDVSARVHTAMFAAARTALAAGQSVVLDAVFLDPAMRDRARAAAGAHPFQGLWLEAPLSVLRARVSARRGDASDADLAVLDSAAQADAGVMDWTRIDAAGDAVAAARGRLAFITEIGA